MVERREARSGEPGAYDRIGSFTGSGDLENRLFMAEGIAVDQGESAILDYIPIQGASGLAVMNLRKQTGCPNRFAKTSIRFDIGTNFLLPASFSSNYSTETGPALQ